MRVLLGAILLSWAVAALAFGDFEDNSQHVKQIGVQVQKAKAGAKAKAKASGGSAELSVQEAKIPDPSAIAPNPHAAPPSASCWIGASVTAAVSEFGIGVSGMEWDPICGLWLAAQQVEGEAQNEATTAAFCMTMEKAGVKNKTCDGWKEGQYTHVALDPDNRAAVVYQGGNLGGGWR